MDPTLLTVVAAGAAALLAGGVFWLVQRRGLLHFTNAGAFHHFRCSGCGRRLRFQARQAGRRGKCSHCGGSVAFPAVSQSID